MEQRLEIDSVDGNIEETFNLVWYEKIKKQR